ncbi:MAG: flippase-like domain-containing protein [Spirochaetes bacterium]|nr:flippase-like domain-containing protein [Spirochaetota bacterium]
MKKARYIFLIIGILILIFLFKTFGFQKTISQILSVGWGFWIIVSIFIFSHIFLTLGWKVVINHPVPLKTFILLIFARIAGDSTSSINAFGSIAGEPLKAMFMKKYIPFQIGLASVVLDRTAHSLANALMFLTGIILSLFILKLPLYITAIALGFFSLTLLIIFLIIQKQREGLLDFIISIIPSRLSTKIITEDRRKKIEELDEEIKYIFSSKSHIYKFIISVLLHYFAVTISCTLEIYLIVYFLNIQFNIYHALFLYVFGLFLTSVMFFMPANLGTSEGSYSLALKLLGYDPSMGLTIGIVRRLRTFIWSIIGIIILILAGLKKNE